MKNEKSIKMSNLINDCSFNPRVVGVEMSTDHRYLQQEFFKCSLAFIACLANNYRKGMYDGRNEFACKCADLMMKGLEESEMYFKKFEDNLYNEILSSNN